MAKNRVVVVVVAVATAIVATVKRAKAKAWTASKARPATNRANHRQRRWSASPSHRRPPTKLSQRRPHRPRPLLPQRWKSPLRWRSKRSEEHTSELQSHSDLVCRLL